MERVIVLWLLLVGVSSLTDEEINQFYNDGCAGGSVSVSRSDDGESVILSTNGVPDHKWQDCNPNTVGNQSWVVTMPDEPEFADEPYCLALGAIGWAVNGVAIFNPFAGGNTNAVDGATQEQFDICDGHAEPFAGEYHYHRLPMSCVYVDGIQREQFIGVAKDGFPIYGPYQADLERDATNDDLDYCHGRSVDGRYRYVFLARGEANFPYIMGCIRGVPGLVTGGDAPEHTTCGTCTDDGVSPCYAQNEVCACITQGPSGPVQGVELLSYDDTSTDGDPTTETCTDASRSETCRDPHDETPDAYKYNPKSDATTTFLSAASILLTVLHL